MVASPTPQRPPAGGRPPPTCLALAPVYAPYRPLPSLAARVPYNGLSPAPRNSSAVLPLAVPLWVPLCALFRAPLGPDLPPGVLFYLPVGVPLPCPVCGFGIPQGGLWGRLSGRSWGTLCGMLLAGQATSHAAPSLLQGGLWDTLPETLLGTLQDSLPCMLRGSVPYPVDIRRSGLPHLQAMRWGVQVYSCLRVFLWRPAWFDCAPLLSSQAAKASVSKPQQKQQQERWHR